MVKTSLELGDRRVFLKIVPTCLPAIDSLSEGYIIYNLYVVGNHLWKNLDVGNHKYENGQDSYLEVFSDCIQNFSNRVFHTSNMKLSNSLNFELYFQLHVRQDTIGKAALIQNEISRCNF